MVQIQPITPRIIFVNPNGTLTREGFQVLQAVQATIEGTPGSGNDGIADLSLKAIETEGLIGGISVRVSSLASRLGEAQKDVRETEGGVGPLMARIGSVASRIARSAILKSPFVAALADMTGNGMLAKTGTGTVAARTITGTAPITVTNGDGAAGNPTIAASAASAAARGVVELATNAETITGTDTARAVTPAGGAAAYFPLTSFAASTWTPTLTNVLNVDSTTALECHYIRLGSRVICFGGLVVDPTAAADTVTEVGISLPVASNLTVSTDAQGTGSTAGAQRAARVSADATNDRARFLFASETAAAITFTFIFGYAVK